MDRISIETLDSRSWMISLESGENEPVTFTLAKGGEVRFSTHEGPHFPTVLVGVAQELISVANSMNAFSDK